MVNVLIWSSIHQGARCECIPGAVVVCSKVADCDLAYLSERVHLVEADGRFRLTRYVNFSDDRDWPFTDQIFDTVEAAKLAWEVRR